MIISAPRPGAAPSPHLRRDTLTLSRALDEARQARELARAANDAASLLLMTLTIVHLYHLLGDSTSAEREYQAALAVRSREP